MASKAQRLYEIVSSFLGGGFPLQVQAWDGSVAGPRDAPKVIIRSRRALRRLLWAPNETGLTEAYINGELDIEGDLGKGLGSVWASVRSGTVSKPSLGMIKLLPSALRLGVIGPRPRKAGQDAKLSGSVHTKDRDRAAIAHHYDLSNEFYELLLDKSMAYSSGFYAAGIQGSETEADLEKAQQAKLDMVCQKLELAPGSKHLDIGCGWGSLICHAAKNYGTESTGVTLSRQQFDYVSKRIADEGLSDLVTVRLMDYRDLVGSRDYDAVSTIEMGEHVGDAEYPAFAGLIRDALKPGGKALIQQMSRGQNNPGGGEFIEKYIAPDMHMKPLGTTVNLLTDAGLEVRAVQAMREHYTWTIRAWAQTFESRLPEVIDMLGETGARVWRLYLVGSALAFEENRMGVDQILVQRP